MDRIDYKNMTNAELKLCIETLENEFEAKKAEMVKICGELEEIQRKYNDVNSEISLRQNIF